MEAPIWVISASGYWVHMPGTRLVGYSQAAQKIWGAHAGYPDNMSGYSQAALVLVGGHAGYPDKMSGYS